MCGKDQIMPFDIRVGTVMNLQDCLSAREDRESSLSPLSRPCEVGASMFISRKDLITPF